VTLSVADRLDILDVITRADDAASRRDGDTYVSLFTEDAVLDGGQGRHPGREALRAAVGPIWAAEGAATLHLTLNPIVEALDDSDSDGGGDSGPRAAVRSVLLIVDVSGPPALKTAAAITQTLRRDNGSWRITRRTVASAAG
jgi:hypothetical protein